MLTLVEAIAKEEGFYNKGSRPFRNNNPGDLEYGAFSIRNGATKGDPRFAVFPDVETGFKALTVLLKYNYEGLTIEQAINRFAPAFENNSRSYLMNVCQWSGLNTQTVITDQILGL